MIRNVIALLVLLLSAGQVGASCVQCPTPPCEIQQCPPDNVEIFAEIQVNGVDTGLGGQVEVGEGLLLSVQSIADAGGTDADFVLAVEVSDASAFGGHSFRLELAGYNLVNGVWQYQGTTQDSTPLFETPLVDAGDCAFYGTPCNVGSEGECASNFCSTGTYCNEPYEFCLIASGWCEEASNECRGCSTGDLTCPDMNDLFPLPTLRRKVCPAGWEKCKFKVIDISEW